MASDPLPSPGLGFPNPFARIDVQDIWYNGKIVPLDGYNFISCRFDNCTLHVASGNFGLRNCFVDPSTKIAVNGNVVNVLRLFNFRVENIDATRPYFAALRNSDGTISITDDPR